MALLVQVFPLTNILRCSPLRLGPFFRPIVAVRPLRPAKDHRLGEPLPPQLPNPTQAFQLAITIFQYIQYLLIT